MFYRECRKCGCAMDPEEGLGTVCDECIKKESAGRARKEAMDFLLGADTAFKQMEMEDFISGS